MAKKQVPVQEPINETPRRVRIKLYKDRGKYSQDVLVIVNGMSYLIQRGVEVEVPYEVAEVLKNSDDLRAQTVDMMDDMSSEFMAKSRRI